MSEVEVSARARKAVGRSSKFAAREVQLVVKIPWRILGQEKECVVHVQEATRGGEGSRVVICQRKESGTLWYRTPSEEGGCQVGQTS